MKTIVTLFLLWSSVSMFAQQNNDLINTKFTEKSQYLFNEFVDGKVHLKSGMISSEKLNYNLFSGEICFIRNNTILEITNKKDILFIVLHDYKFYCFNEKYYFSIFNHKGTKILKTMKVDDEDANKVSGTYGISKETTFTQDVSAVIHSQQLGLFSKVNYLDENEKLYDIEEKFYLYDNDICSLNKRRLKKTFKDKSSDIDRICKKNKIRFNNEKDIKLLLNSIFL